LADRGSIDSESGDEEEDEDHVMNRLGDEKKDDDDDDDTMFYSEVTMPTRHASASLPFNSSPMTSDGTESPCASSANWRGDLELAVAATPAMAQQRGVGSDPGLMRDARMEAFMSMLQSAPVNPPPAAPPRAVKAEASASSSLSFTERIPLPRARPRSPSTSISTSTLPPASISARDKDEHKQMHKPSSLPAYAGRRQIGHRAVGAASRARHSSTLPASSSSAAAASAASASRAASPTVAKPASSPGTQPRRSTQHQACRAQCLHPNDCTGRLPSCRGPVAEELIRMLRLTSGEFRMTEGDPRHPKKETNYANDGQLHSSTQVLEGGTKEREGSIQIFGNIRLWTEERKMDTMLRTMWTRISSM